MLFTRKTMASSTTNSDGLWKALDAAQAIIQFDLQGNILLVNENFLKTMGYKEDEVVGKHHRIFAEPAYAASAEYAAFWTELRTGEAMKGEFKRLKKDGSDVWLEASYNPIFDENGTLTGIVKFAIDITAAKNKNVDFEGQVNAISRSQAVIEFTPDAEIITANENFCAAMGYQKAEIVGKKHAMFVDPTYAKSAAYADFWASLRNGDFFSSEFQRVAKGGATVWIQASYNPIFDADGKLYKIVKFATDITERREITAKLAENLDQLAAGNLSPRMPSNANDDFAKLCEAFNKTMERFTSLVADIQGASDAVSTGTKEIAQGARNLSERTEDQAASLEETNAAIEAITNNISITAKNAKKAHTAASEAEQKAVRGDSVVRSAISAMERIEDGSKKITEIISVIESISFQTNLLALNAAVEAARAGESGKGFAVVASEVRTLAQRSSEAANDITDLIERSTSQVEEGAGLVRDTGRVLVEIKSSIDHVADNVDEISKASAEQANGIAEISEVVSGIDANTQDNAQLAQVSATNAMKLAKQSDQLSDLAAFFSSSEANIPPLSAAEEPDQLLKKSA